MAAKKRGAKKPVKKGASKKPAPKKAAPKKAAPKKAPPKKASKPAPKKAAAKKPTAKKPAPKKPAAKKAAPAKAAPKKTAPPARARVARAAERAERAKAEWEQRPKRRVEPDEPRERTGDRDAAFVNRADKPGDDLAGELGESFLQSATSGEESAMEIQNAETEEEQGGPFIETTAQEEFADDVDESNPEDAEPAALPTTASDTESEEE